MKIDVIQDIEEVTRQQFDALDGTAGAAGCYDRIKQREADRRWHASYLRLTENGALVALVPLYRCAGSRWPAAAYDPSTWGFPEGVTEGIPPGEALLVGGCSDIRSGLHVHRNYRTREQLRRIVVAAAQQASEREFGLAFPYAFSQARQLCEEATDGAISWAVLAREAHLLGTSAPDWESRQKSKVRSVLRRDRNLISEVGVTVAVRSWAEVDDRACELIAAHNTGKGYGDHPEFVRMRHEEWSKCPGVQLVVFTATAGDIAGMLTAFIWNNQLELYEVGLDGAEGRERLATYLSLLFHEPINFARSRGLENIRAGVAAETPKVARGAVFETLYGGVLTPSATRRLATV